MNPSRTISKTESHLEYMFESTSLLFVVPLIIRSLAKYVDYETLFTETKQGIAFYEKFFDWKYVVRFLQYVLRSRFPFTKLDSLFVPEYNAGAMENVGCVTYTEYVSST